MEQTAQPTKPPYIVTVLLSIITAAVLGSFTFLWGMNRDFGVMQERDRMRSINESDWKNDLKEMKIDVNEQKGKMIRIEGIVNDIQSNYNKKNYK